MSKTSLPRLMFTTLILVLVEIEFNPCIKSEKETEIAIVHVKEDETVFVDQELIDFL